MKQAQCIAVVEVAGWKVARMLLPAGMRYGVIVGTRKRREAFGASALWVRGMAIGVNHTTGKSIVRKPGVFLGTTEAIEAGRYEVKAIEDTEWWCVDAKGNRGMLPHVYPITLGDGPVQAPAAGAMLVCEGDGIVVPGGHAYHSQRPGFGLVFELRAP